MKQKLLKTMLLLCALVVGGSSAWGDSKVLTFDVTSNPGGWPTTNSTTLTNYTYTLSAVNYTFALNNVKCNSGYLMLTSTAVLGLPAIEGYKLTKVVASNSGSCSTSTKVGISSSSSSASYITGGAIQTWSSTSSTYTYNLTSTEANTVYYLYVTNKNAQVTELELTYESVGGSGPAVAAPTFDPAGGTYSAAQGVEISCATDGATIYYTMTTDGSNPEDPTDSDDEFTTAISVTKSGTKIKAIAIKGDDESSVASATYTIKPTTPIISAAGSTVTITGDDGCSFYYTLDNSTPTSMSTEYSEPFTQTSDCTIKAIAYDTYGNASAVKTYTFKYFPLNPKNINSGYFEKVTNVSDLEDGDAILIVNRDEDEDVALSTTQNSNNRGKAEVVVSGDAIYSSTTADAQKLVLVKKTESIKDVDTDVFYFYTGSGYLYASSSSSNQLKTETTPDDNNNARATIAISSGVATITFTGNNSRNLMQYNSTSSIFACYASASQNEVQIYKEVAHNESVSITSVGYATFASDCGLDFSGTGINAYIAETKGTGKGVKFTSVTKVPANTGVLLYKDGGTVSPVSVPAFNGAGAADVSVNVFVRGEGSTVQTDDGDNYNYILNNVGGVIGFYKANAQIVAANRAYISILKSEGTPGVKGFIALPGFEEDDEDGINTVNGEGFMVNGPIYNLSGQRVNKAQKGLYIVNGKKVLF